MKWELRAARISIAFLRRVACGKVSNAGPSPWMGYAGFVESGDSQSSRSIDDFVYGSKVA
jgi:hypothetical protein